MCFKTKTRKLFRFWQEELNKQRKRIGTSTEIFFTNKQTKYRIVPSTAESKRFDGDKRERRIAAGLSVAKFGINGINNNHTDNNVVVVSKHCAKQHSAKQRLPSYISHQN